MASGPEHFKLAEDGITASTWQRQHWGEHDSNSDEAAAALEAATWELRVAQVHATLAVAAATADLSGDAHPDWGQVLQ